MSPEERIRSAFAFAQDSTKQLIGLATGVIALTVTFSRDVAGTVNPSAQAFLLWSWVAFLVSVVFGVWTLLALTGSLEPRDETGDAKVPSIRGPNVTRPALLQIVAFVAGLLLAIVFAAKAI